MSHPCGVPTLDPSTSYQSSWQYIIDTSIPPPAPISVLSIAPGTVRSSVAQLQSAVFVTPPPNLPFSGHVITSTPLPVPVSYQSQSFSVAPLQSYHGTIDYSPYLTAQPTPLPNGTSVLDDAKAYNAEFYVKRESPRPRPAEHVNRIRTHADDRRFGRRFFTSSFRRRDYKRRKTRVLNGNSLAEFQKKFDNLKNEGGSDCNYGSGKFGRSDDSKIPLCYRMDKTVELDKQSRKKSTDNHDSSSAKSDESPFSDGELSDNDSPEDGHISKDERQQEQQLKIKSTLEEDALRYADVMEESSLSETEDERTAFGEKESDQQWIQSSRAKLYYVKDESVDGKMNGTNRQKRLMSRFENKVLKVCDRSKFEQLQFGPPPPNSAAHTCRHHCGHKRRNRGSSSSSSSSSSSADEQADSKSKSPTKHTHPTSCDSSSDSETENVRFKAALQEIRRKEEHPARLHKDLWFNESDQMNDGPLCRCSWKAKQTGIAHSMYKGEKPIALCDPNSNNADRLYHYRLDIKPMTNVSIKPSTKIDFDGHEFVFEGFSLFSHEPLPEKFPLCNVVRWNIDYKLTMIKEEPPENFCVKELELFWNYFFVHLLELLDVNMLPTSCAADLELAKRGQLVSCPVFHIMPRFVRSLEDDDDLSSSDSQSSYSGHCARDPQPDIKRPVVKGVEILSMHRVLKYLADNFEPLFSARSLESIYNWSNDEWDRLLAKVKGQLVTNPSKRPSTIRVDQVDRSMWSKPDSLPPNNGAHSSPYCQIKPPYPSLVHFGTRPAVLTYTGNPVYQRAWKQFVKFRHLLAMKSKLTREDKTKLANKEQVLHQLRAKASLKRDVTVELSSEGFYRTGIYPDMVQHGLMMLVIFGHIRLHWSFAVFEKERIGGYRFKNRALLELAFTHPSYRSNYGTNPDHARNTLSNCGIRQPEYGDKKSQQLHSRKRGINTLIDIMSRLGSRKVKQSLVANNERLEYLGDAVIEFLTTIHLFFMFPDLQEGGLATYRSSLVQNKHLAILGKKLGLEDYMLFAHGPDLCHEADLRHAIANAFEALMGALFLDGGIEVVDNVFGNALFLPDSESDLNKVWFHLPKHPLQAQEPDGDRHWVKEVALLQKLDEFEQQTGITFKHIRLLARAFTRKNVGYNNLTLGHNQRLEFLGDTVLQLVTSEYLYKHFPEHHEGHLSLLRSCLVKNKTQSIICDDLAIINYIVQPPAFSKLSNPELRMKDKADLVEAFLGALYVDRGLEACKTFCRVCLYPRLRYFIMTQKWNDPKSQLQQCCLTVRNPDGGEPDIPVYKVIAVEGPTNTRVYKVAVYFKSKRLATGCAHSVQEAEMNAAEQALIRCAHLFPHLQKQRCLIDRRFRRSAPRAPASSSPSSNRRSMSRRGAVPSATNRNAARGSIAASSANNRRRSSSAFAPSPNRRLNRSFRPTNRRSPTRFSANHNPTPTNRIASQSAALPAYSSNDGATPIAWAQPLPLLQSVRLILPPAADRTTNRGYAGFGTSVKDLNLTGQFGSSGTVTAKRFRQSASQKPSDSSVDVSRFGEQQSKIETICSR